MTSEDDANPFPEANAANEGTLFTDVYGVTYVCEKLSIDERADMLDDDEISMEEYAWRTVG